MDFQAIIDEEIKNLELPPKPISTQKLSNRVIIMGLPECPQDKVDKLTMVLKKLFQSKNLEINDIFFPMLETNTTKGLAFVTLKSETMTKASINFFNGYPFDKKHRLSVIPLDEYKNFEKLETNFQVPEQTPMRLKEDMKSFLLQKQCKDQLLINHKSNDITISQHSSKSLELLMTKEQFTNSRAYWSPNGTYLTTLHDRGTIMWGGPNFDMIHKLSHQKVEHIEFSPDEKFIITYSLNNDTYKVIVWETLSDTTIREFSIEKNISTSWPIFKFSFDGKYFARLQTDRISIYESSTCVMLDKKSIDINGVQNFEWSSKGYLLSYWVAEVESSPARVVLIEIPSKREICAKTLFNVANISLSWSFDDDFLAVVSERYTKKKYLDQQNKGNGLTATLEIYKITEKEIPVDKIEIDAKAQISNFKWEPTGKKFAYLTWASKCTLYINDMVSPKDNKSVDCAIKMDSIDWSPSGQVLICKSASGNIDFINGYDGSVLSQVEGGRGEVSWDPTGRYVSLASLSLINEKADCTVSFYNLIGKIQYESHFFGIKQVLWRPRPATLLSEAKIKAIKKDMRKYNKQFAHEDDLSSNDAKRIMYEKRQQLMDDWSAIKKNINDVHRQQIEIRIQMRNNVDMDSRALSKTMEGSYILVSSQIVKVL